MNSFIIQERQTSKEGNNAAMFRISSEGLPLLLPHITKQVISAKEIDFNHLLQYKTIKFADFVDAEFGEKASKLLLGCCVVVLNKGFSNIIFNLVNLVIGSGECA